MNKFNSTPLLDLDYVVRLPGLVIELGPGAVEADGDQLRPTGDRLDPVLLVHAFRLLRREPQFNRTIGSSLDLVVLVARGQQLRRLGHGAVGRVVERHCPVELGCLGAKDKIVTAPASKMETGGLELLVGADLIGFIDQAEDPFYAAIPDYLFPGVGNENAATILAGIVGLVLAFGIGYGLAYLLVSVRRSRRAVPG